MCAKRYGNLFKFAQADKIHRGDGFSCEEPVPCLPQPFVPLLFGLSSLLLVPAFPLLVLSLLRARTHRDMERVVALYGTDEQRYW